MTKEADPILERVSELLKEDRKRLKTAAAGEAALLKHRIDTGRRILEDPTLIDYLRAIETHEYRVVVDNKTMFTLDEVAARLDVSVGRIRQFVSEGRLKTTMWSGRRFVTEAEAERFASVPRLSGRPGWG